MTQTDLPKLRLGLATAAQVERWRAHTDAWCFFCSLFGRGILNEGENHRVSVFSTKGTPQHVVRAIDEQLGSSAAMSARTFMRPYLASDDSEIVKLFDCSFDDYPEDDVCATLVDTSGRSSARFAGFVVKRMLLARWRGTCYMFIAVCNIRIKLCPVGRYHGAVTTRHEALKGIASDLVNRQLAQEACQFVNVFFSSSSILIE
jgi:hypothetical protein